jgi:Kef-type K+ transport system membrane component KefB
VLAVAVAGKWGGGSIAARLSGRGWRDAMSLGVLMNCRGLTELIVLNTGLGLGVIDSALFTILVLMALVTTAMTTPVLTWIRKGVEENVALDTPRRSRPEPAMPNPPSSQRKVADLRH